MSKYKDINIIDQAAFSEYGEKQFWRLPQETRTIIRLYIGKLLCEGFEAIKKLREKIKPNRITER